MQVSQGIIIKNILTEAVKRGAADLHFSVGSVPIIRVRGELAPMEEIEPVNEEFMQELVEMVLNVDQRAQLTKDKEIVLAYDFDKNLRFKVNIFYQKGFVSATLRYVPMVIPSMASLGLGSEIADLAKIKRGLIIVAGPFGSGRSSTIAAIIEAINQNRKEYIITLENPIEYLFVNKKSVIEQREVGRDTPSYRDALSYFQEEDGDVLFLEELQDPEIIPVVLEIARSSALVICSMSVDSATNAVSRIINSFTSFDQERIRNLLATSLQAVICQKLLPRIGGGLVPVHEIMTINDAVKSNILNGAFGQLNNIIQTSRGEGMISFDQRLAELVKSGQISQEDAMGSAMDKSKLQNLL